MQSIRIDTLNPDLLHGDDVNWWLEVMAVLSNGEMPPADAAELADTDRSEVVEWLSLEVQTASTVRRAEQRQATREDIPLSNLFVTMLQRLGVQTEKFADSTGVLADV